MKHLLITLALLCCLCGMAAAEEILTPGTQTQRGFVNDNMLHDGSIKFLAGTRDGAIYTIDSNFHAIIHAWEVRHAKNSDC